MRWTDKVVLTQAQADAINLTRPADQQLKAGDDLTVGFLLMWGAAGTARQDHNIAASFTQMTSSLTHLGTTIGEALSGLTTQMTEVNAKLDALNAALNKPEGMEE